MQLTFDQIKKLHQKKYRNEYGHFLVEGEHLVQELEKAATQNPALLTCELLVTEQYQHWPTQFKKNLVTHKQITQLTDTQTPQGIIAVAPCAPAPGTSKSAHREHTFYFYEIQDPGNLGTILRSLAWFGNCRCLLSPGSVDPYNPKVVRASMGAIFHLPFELDVPLDSLPSRFKRIACLDMNGKPLSDAQFKQQDCYIFGNEARGIPRDSLELMKVDSFTIPGCGAIESLNLASTLNMCVYELMR